MKAIDLFAGLGGFTEGARRAGVKVVWAANHWPKAVEFHALNNPETEHACVNLVGADWRAVPRPDMMLASPACQGHFYNNSKLPFYDDSRASATAVFEAADALRPPVIIVENIPRFRLWAAETNWQGMFKAIGYSASVYVLNASRSGAPQDRVRVFYVFTLSKHPIVLNIPTREVVPASSFLELENPASWSPVLRPGRALATVERVRAGYRDVGETFVMPYYSKGSGLTGRSIARPLGTVTTRDRWAVVCGDYMRMLRVTELVKAMTFPVQVQLPKTRKLAIHLLGNAVCPAQACDLITAVKEAA